MAFFLTSLATDYCYFGSAAFDPAYLDRHPSRQITGV